MIEQGDVYWVDLPEPIGAEPGFRHPCVVIQNNAYNFTRLKTVVVCILTSNIRLADMPGNVLLPMQQTGLPRPSVANVTQLLTVDRTILEDKTGTLSSDSIHQIFMGILGLTDPARFEI
jgi:mRNA interferase MazF